MEPTSLMALMLPGPDMALPWAAEHLRPESITE